MSVHDYLLYVIMPILCLAQLFILLRFLKGPQVVDRIVALDLLITVGVAFILIFSIIVDNSIFLDVAMILALIAFLSTVALSFYIQNSKKDD
ncbi:monovalent cation/H+ antiporter complex subunit F [Avrilella dinanensis]|uniref:Cation:proton antiporter n=1 Tax=Avrilella dinanensis TaxID=2008672 RepID=A0A2M9R5L6_9FLAO|nr:monovalent cation/H+ antiporter complex subunit F [Avrilella dinanensis]PJR04157.1 cation:proton antiporter [Avrilella dinanensis]